MGDDPRPVAWGYRYQHILAHTGCDNPTLHQIGNQIGQHPNTSPQPGRCHKGQVIISDER